MPGELEGQRRATTQQQGGIGCFVQEEPEPEAAGCTDADIMAQCPPVGPIFKD